MNRQSFTSPLHSPLHPPIFPFRALSQSNQIDLIISLIKHYYESQTYGKLDRAQMFVSFQHLQVRSQGQSVQDVNQLLELFHGVS